MGPGIWEIELASWKYFPDLVNSHGKLFASTQMIWRGHAAANWSLTSTLDRLLISRGTPGDQVVRERHLRNFQLAARGRRGAIPHVLTEDEWWALGQHYGLATPLLDWTRSPYVGLYFAFERMDTDDDTHRAVWSLNRYNVEHFCRQVLPELPSKPEALRIIEPMIDENARLVNQGGLFTTTTGGFSVEKWVADAVPEKHEHALLNKIVIPNKDREDCLRGLNAMNINRSSLFPDLSGAAAFCNLDLEIRDY